MLNRIIWNWDIHYACNYRCPYCFLAGKWDDAAKENRYPGIERWKEVWNRIYDKYGSCHIHFSGGEPFIYPDFIDLIDVLLEKHTLEFSTNLSFDIDDFITRINPAKVRLGASFHPQFVAFGEFLEKVLQLKIGGYPVHITYVAYPPQLKDTEVLRSECERKDIKLVIQPFRGKYKEMVYPGSYSESEKKMLKPYGASSLSSEIQFNFHLEEKQKENKLCYMGYQYGKIYASADVYKCCSTGAEKLGNLIDNEDFSLLEKPMPCEIKNCLCWRRMLAGEEDKWMTLWV